MLRATIELTKFRGCEIEKREIEGEIEECISIPIKKNGLLMSKNKRVHLQLLIRDRKPNCYNISHYITAYISDKKIYDEINERGFMDNYKFIGNAYIEKDKRNAKDKKTDINEAMNTD